MKNDNAITDEQKADAVERLLKAWRKVSYMRLGQLLMSSAPRRSYDGSGRYVDLYHEDDARLLAYVEAFAADELPGGGCE